MSSPAIDDYQKNSLYAQQQITYYEKENNTYSLLRLVVFALFIVAVYISAEQDSWILFISSLLILALAFNWLLNRQSIFQAQQRYFKQFKAVNENELSCINRQGNIYVDGGEFYNDKHYYTADLDIFGKGSLFQLINRCATATGAGLLGTWLAAPATKERIEARQQAIKEIAAHNEWKLHLQSQLLFANKQSGQAIKQLSTYLQMPVNMTGENWLRYYTQIAPFIMLGMIILCVFYPPARYFTGVLALAHLRLVASKKEYIHKTDLIAGKLGETLNQYAVAFESTEAQTWKSPYLVELHKKLNSGNHTLVSQQIKQLSVLINKLNYRLNMVANFVLNVFFLWNIRQVIAIENWKRSNRATLETAFEALAEFEVLLSLAGIAINYPEWSFPVIAEGEAYTLSGQSIGHPLISDNYRVPNNYELTNAYHIDLITGSNMAGKSTFLRTLGINAVLAMCGAPVCARHMEVSVMQLFTYMRIKDSLNESTSTFKAELDRLQLLLHTVAQPGKVFFLIDEMLRGTNSVDKYLGSKAIIERLITQQGTGLVATHDLQLAELEQQYPDYIRNFYFDIQVVDGEMRFDYKLKPGECKTFNASLLLKQIGIDVESNIPPQGKDF